MLSEALQILIADDMVVTYLTDCDLTLPAVGKYCFYSSLFTYSDTKSSVYYRSEPFYSCSMDTLFTLEDITYLQTTYPEFFL